MINKKDIVEETRQKIEKAINLDGFFIIATKNGIYISGRKCELANTALTIRSLDNTVTVRINIFEIENIS